MARRHFRLAILLAAGLLSAVVSPAQQPTNPPGELAPEKTVSVMGQSVGLVAKDGEIHGGGPDYLFAVRRITGKQTTASFTPALGANAPSLMPVHFTLQGVGRGDQATNSQRPLPQPHMEVKGTTALIRHGACVERYALRPDGVKQSFIFARRPQGEGDLSVVLGIDTELTSPAWGDVSSGLTLGSEHGGVHIGAVLGIDATGREIDGTMHFDGSSLTLSLPARFVDDAMYPIELDPLLGSSFDVSIGSSDDGSTDVAYDDGSDCYLIVWRRVFSASTVLIRGQRVSTSGSLVGGLIPIRSFNVSTAPSVGNVKRSGEFLVCYEHGPSLFGPFEIHGNTVDAGSGSVSSSIVIGTSSINDIRPDVSSNATGQSVNAIVVWERDRTVQARLVSCNAGSTPVAGASTSIPGGVANPRPAISKHGGSAGRHVVIFENRGGVTRSIRAQAVDFNLNLLGNAVTLSDAAQLGEHPDVDGDGTEFMAVWHENEPASSQRTDVRGRILRWDGSGLTLVTPALDIGVRVDSDEGFPAVAFCGGKYLVAHEDQAFAPVGVTTRSSMFDRAGQPCDVRVNSGNLTDPVIRPAVCSRLSGGESSDEGLLVLTIRSATPPFAGDILAVRFESYRGRAPISVGPGCGPGGVAGVNGPFSMGNPEFKFVVSGADPATQVFGFLLNLAGPPLTPCGSCTFTDPLAIFIVPPSGSGEAEFPFPTPCDSSYIGTNMEFQWLAIGGHTARPCPMARRVAASDRVRLTFDY